MKSDDKLPHFLRVARSIAGVRGAALPLAAVFTTVVAGVHCGSTHVGDCMGFCGPQGAGGASSSSSSGTGGSGGSSAGMDGGYDGGPVATWRCPTAATTTVGP